jgi:hypothetical protein
MAEDRLIDKVSDLMPGDHLCCIYSSEDEHRALLTPYLRQGLEYNQRVLYIVDAHTAKEVLGYLRDDGLVVEPYLESGQLFILTVDDAYMKGGVFDPDGMIRLLTEETDLAVSQGYAALRVTGEMTWALRGLPGSERLIEYEAKLNLFLPESKCMALCQYDRWWEQRSSRISSTSPPTNTRDSRRPLLPWITGLEASRSARYPRQRCGRARECSKYSLSPYPSAFS